MNRNNYCVIMAGGVGSRFWPLSRTNKPKQFLDILGTGKSLIQQTYDRFRKIVPEENILIQSVPGLAGTAAAGIIAFLPELGLVDRQAASALLGVAPFNDDSGKHRGERHIEGGRRKLRKLLFMPIVGAATQHNPVLKAYYQRLIAKGKKAKVALVACMRKLIGILNTMLARGEKWDSARHAVA